MRSFSGPIGKLDAAETSETKNVPSNISSSEILSAAILVVDSDAESLYSIASILITNQYCVTTARNACTAVEMAKHQTLDLIISETHIGDSRGEELVGSIRHFPDKSDVPALFVSATQKPGVIYRADAGGAGFHLKKPIDQKLLLEMVERALWLPHLVQSHIEQKAIKAPHVSFAKNPLANPLPIPDYNVAGFVGTPLSF
ncbi:MAG: response regulator [Mariniblastus sp.]